MKRHGAIIAIAAVCACLVAAGLAVRKHAVADVGTSEPEAVPDPEWNDIIAEDGLPNGAFLPDTTYASADILKYRVDVFDTLTDGTVDLHDLYSNSHGILCFRKNPARTADFGGRVDGYVDSIGLEWEYQTENVIRHSNLGDWGGGTGWTGQPLYVEWPDSILTALRKNVGLQLTSNREIISASLSGNICFIDFETGKPSREPMYVNHPVKGTPMLDPTMNGLLYLGHGVKADSLISWGQLTVDVFHDEMKDFFGPDRYAWRGWNGNDSSPIRLGNFVFRPSENGTLYKWLVTDDGPVLHSTLRYRVKGSAPGFEASLGVWRNYGYINDNHGYVICIDLNTLKPVWCYWNHDDSDATPVVCIEDGHAYVYTGSEVDLHPASETAYFVKLDALTGEPVWENTCTARRETVGDKHFDGGYYCTVLPGTGNCSDRIFVNRVLNGTTYRRPGEFVAIDRKTGKDIYTVKLAAYSWSSPVSLTNEKGELVIFTVDSAGEAYLIDGLSGEIRARRYLGPCFESSPAVIGDRIVVGSRGKSIYCFKVCKKRQS